MAYKVSKYNLDNTLAKGQYMYIPAEMYYSAGERLEHLKIVISDHIIA